MESILILMSAGVLVAILGAILFTSERELKAKRRQIEELLAKLENSPQAGLGATATASQLAHDDEFAKLQAENRDLQAQLRALSGKLELSQKTIDELQAERENKSALSTDTDRLRLANEQLQTQLHELNSRLVASEEKNHASAAQNQGNAESYTRLQAELAELRQQLEARQGKIRELEAKQQNISDINAIEAGHRQERQVLQDRIAELEQRLLADQATVSEAQTLRQRLAESEQSQMSLRDAISRHEEENARWQARIAEGEEHRRRLASLRAPLDELISRQTELALQQRRLQEDLTSFTGLLSTSMDATQTIPMASGIRDVSAPPGNESAAKQAATEPTDSSGQPEAKRARSYGILAMVILMIAGGVLAFQVIDSSPTREMAATASTKPLMAQVEPASATPTTPEQELAAVEAVPVSEAPPVKEMVAKAVSNARIDNNERAGKTVKSEPRVAGIFRITRPSRVYAAPTEYSRAIGDIEPGVKVNVVDARDGWLEIHSKHGRPPGFIRTEVASRISGPN